MLVSTPNSSSRLPKASRTRGSVIIVAVVLVLACVAAYAILQASASGEATIAISFVSKTGSCSLTFNVTNKANKILHGWVASVRVSPVESNISVTPALAPVIPLAPEGSYNATVTVTFVGVVPPGRYDLQASLLNGTRTIASSNTLSCVEPSS